jgi:hypothetical protein
MKIRVSAIFENPLNFVAFYNLGLPRFYRMPMGEVPSLPVDEEEMPDEDSECEAKMLTVMEVPEDDLPALEAVVQSYGGRVVSSDELDAMGI